MRRNQKTDRPQPWYLDLRDGIKELGNTLESITKRCSEGGDLNEQVIMESWLGVPVIIPLMIHVQYREEFDPVAGRQVRIIPRMYVERGWRNANTIAANMREILRVKANESATDPDAVDQIVAACNAIPTLPSGWVEWTDTSIDTTLNSYKDRIVELTQLMEGLFGWEYLNVDLIKLRDAFNEYMGDIKGLENRYRG